MGNLISLENLLNFIIFVGVLSRGFLILIYWQTLSQWNWYIILFGKFISKYITWLWNGQIKNNNMFYWVIKILCCAGNGKCLVFFWKLMFVLLYFCHLFTICMFEQSLHLGYLSTNKQPSTAQGRMSLLSFKDFYTCLYRYVVLLTIDSLLLSGYW